jgi:putative spermidine/putrescine transport system permease protein
LIVNAARRHLVAGVPHHLRGCVVFESLRIPQEKRRLARLREFRRAAETTILGIVGFATLLALPLAWYLWCWQSLYIRLLAGLAMTPFMLPPVIIAIGFLLFWGALGHVGRIENTIIAHGVLFATLPLVTISVGLNAIDRSLLDAAKTMGADDKTVFRTVILPLIVPYVISGYCFALVLSLNESIVAYMVAGYAVESLPVKMLYSLS